MGVSYLGARLDALQITQNPDGGWGYFAGKQSWLEPTAYAAIALHGTAAADRAWALLASWQRQDGSWRPSQEVEIDNWGAALCSTLANLRGEFGASYQRGLAWLLDMQGSETRLRNRVVSHLGILDMERNLSLEGWPWKPGTTSWVEPTAHALVALKQSNSKFPSNKLAARVRLGEDQLLDIRCGDGGWNYGSRSAFHIPLPSYPETTGIALLGLQGRAESSSAVDVARRMSQESPSPLARAWLSIGLRLHEAGGLDPAGGLTRDLVLVALQAIATPEGNWAAMKGTLSA